MKFPLLPVGQHFQYQGETLVKIGAMTACNERGGNTRLIPRSAVVVPITDQIALAGASAPLAAERVDAALRGFETKWRGVLNDLDETVRSRLDQALTSAHTELRDALGLGRPPRL